MENRLGVCRDARPVRPLKMLRAFAPTTALFACHRLARTLQQPCCLFVINLARTHEPCVPTHLLPANHFLIGLILKFKVHTSMFNIQSAAVVSLMEPINLSYISCKSYRGFQPKASNFAAESSSFVVGE
ncbi:hypothetical protein HMPREF9944_01948 [Segatella maculosa OT 289]|uniref:Uncharacterized protein n=1 Tax=Segatella maculosa OT 289 TaxID=999422 RepID=H1HP54_9BACT|nr:hypothetical protein HMPREF9944_01948 [Segatella maculosa OT 289]